MILGLTVGLGGDIRQAFDHLDTARASFEELDDAWGAAMSTMLLGYASTFAAQHARAETLARQSLDGFRTAGDQWGQTMALELLGLLARNRGGYHEAIAAYEEALGIVRDLGLRDEIPFLLADLADLHALLESFETATVLHKQALDAAGELGAADAMARARTGLARAARRQGRHDQARELLQRALAFYRDAGFPAETANTLASLGFVEELSGNLDAAEAFHHESLRLARSLTDQQPAAVALEGLACVAAARHEPAQAAALLGTAESIRARAGTPLPPRERTDVDRATDAALSALGSDAFDRALEQGRQKTLDQLLDGAASTRPTPSSPSPTNTPQSKGPAAGNTVATTSPPT
jgi:tetratricopeptide (TPR) repeat protein